MNDGIAMLQAEELRKRELEILRNKVKEQEELIEQLQVKIRQFENIVKHFKNELKSKNDYIDRADELARRSRERRIDGDIF